MTELALRSRIGDIVIERRVSDGASAVVYQGRWHERPVAVKIYGKSVDPGAAARLRLECLAQREVAHPSVVRLLECGELDDGRPYLVSDWVDGPTFEQVLARGPLSWAQLVPCLSAIAAGLAAIHAAGVIHRDLKPSNIVTPERGAPGAVLLDFSHALVLGEERVTHSGWVLGSTAYMAPEHAAGKPIDTRSDLYALGVIVYRALTGTLPFWHASPAEVLRMQRNEPVVPPRERAPALDIPRAAEDLCLWLLAKEPAQRLPSARVLAITLHAMAMTTATATSPRGVRCA